MITKALYELSIGNIQVALHNLTECVSAEHVPQQIKFVAYIFATVANV